MTIGIIKKLLKATRDKKKKHNNIVMLSRSKLNNIKALIFQALKNCEITHEDFPTISDEGRNYRRLKEDTRMIKSQISDTEKKN